MFLDTKKHSKIIKQILVDDQDITTRCRCVNAEEGWAMLYQTWPPTAEDIKQEVYELKTGKIEVVFTPEAQAANEYQRFRQFSTRDCAIYQKCCAR